MLCRTPQDSPTRVKRSSSPELDVPGDPSGCSGDTAQQDSISLPAVTTWRVYRGKAWMNEPQEGEWKKDVTALQNYLHSPASGIISFGWSRAWGADGWHLEDRACEDRTLPTSRVQTTWNRRWVEACALGPGNGWKVGLLAAENTEVWAAGERWETAQCNCCTGLRITKSLRITQRAG